MFKTRKNGRGKAEPAALPASLTKAEKQQVRAIIEKARRDDGSLACRLGRRFSVFDREVATGDPRPQKQAGRDER